jgi:hypothetical protein
LGARRSSGLVRISRPPGAEAEAGLGQVASETPTEADALAEAPSHADSYGLSAGRVDPRRGRPLFVIILVSAVVRFIACASYRARLAPVPLTQCARLYAASSGTDCWAHPVLSPGTGRPRLRKGTIGQALDELFACRRESASS